MSWVQVPDRRRVKSSRKRDIIDLSCEADAPSPHRGQGFVLILVGIPGSGKSHFASRLEGEMPQKFVRVNQDSLKTRKKCEDLCRRTLSQGKVAVVDRTNFDFSQRKTWIDIAGEKGLHCECVVFEVRKRSALGDDVIVIAFCLDILPFNIHIPPPNKYDKNVCITRCQQRRNHETMKPSDASKIVSMMANRFRPPSGGERFHRLSRVSSFAEANDLADTYITS